MAAFEITSSEDLYDFLKKVNGKIVANMLFPNSPGHQIIEADNFLRMHRLKEIPDTQKYFIFQPNADIPSTIARNYQKAFDKSAGIHYIISNSIYMKSLEICRLLPEMTVDVALSGCRAALVDRKDCRVETIGKMLIHRVPNRYVLNATLEYFKRRSQTRDYDPWREEAPELDEPMRDLLGGSFNKLALLHMRYGKNTVTNAGTLTEPSALFPTLSYLRDGGYTIVKVGTERIPPEFAHFGVINYSESPLRSFHNDLALTKAASLYLVNASGLENLPDLMGVPMVSYGRWHLPLQPTSKRCVVLPSMLRDRSNGRLLKFGEQMAVFHSIPETWEKTETGASRSWNCFPYDGYDERPPQADEILAACQEAIALGEGDVPLSAQQQLYRSLDPLGCFKHQQSRICQFFLERMEAALQPGFEE